MAVMVDADVPDAGSEVSRMQGGVRAWVQRTAHGGEHQLRKLSPPVLLSLLCAGAFSPLLVAAGVTGAVAVAGIGVLSSVGGGMLTEVLTGALERLREHDDGDEPSGSELEERIALEIRGVLEAGDARARDLRDDIARVLKQIDAGGTALRACESQSSGAWKLPPSGACGQR